MPERPARNRRPLAIVVIVAGAALLLASASGVFSSGAPVPVSTPAPRPLVVNTLNQTIMAAQDKLRRAPRNPLVWAQLGSAYVEQARITADPSYYPKAQGALEKSLQQQPEANGAALIGLGALANARHDFLAGRDWGERARAALPETAEVYGVLADAQTQLGNSDAATAAVERMLELKPGVSAFTRASYDLELHGRIDEAKRALERSLADATGPADSAFCRYYLGELAFNSGQLDQAADQYEQGLSSDPENVSLLQGQAKVAAARGRMADAIAGYQGIVSRVPLPQYLQEYAELLLLSGRKDEAAQQFDVLGQQQRLLAENGATDDLSASAVAADRGDAGEALTHAKTEWSRRQNVLVADALAWALHLGGHEGEALTYADRAAALGGRNAVFAFHRGMILAGLGRGKEATTALNAALTINPYFSPLHAPEAKQQLDALRGRR